MSLLCKVFGHQPPSMWPNHGGSYMDIKNVHTDGIRRYHARLEGECPRCRQTYTVGMTHLPFQAMDEAEKYRWLRDRHNDRGSSICVMHDDEMIEDHAQMFSSSEPNLDVAVVALMKLEGVR